MIKFVALDVEHPVPAGPIILEGDLRAQLHQLLFRKFLCQPRIKIIGDICRGADHGIRQLDYQMLPCIEGLQVIAFNGEQLLVTQSGLSAYGRVDVDSKRTADARRGAHFGQLDIAQRHTSLATEAGFHRDAAPDEARFAHLDFRRRQILAKRFAHDAVKPTKMPGGLSFFKARNSRHNALIIRLAATGV